MQSKHRNQMKSYRGKSKKVLTNTKVRSIIQSTINNRKDDKTMATKKNKKQSRFSALKKINRNHFKALAWAIFAVHQGFMSWLILTNFNNYFAVAGAVASFGLTLVAVSMVGATIVKATNINE